MKEDYLWNGTGSDPDVENLERALSTLSYRSTPPPAIPRQRYSVPRISWVSVFRFRLGFALASFVVLAFGTLWMLSPRYRITDQPDAIGIEPARRVPGDSTITTPAPIPEKVPQTFRKGVLTASEGPRLVKPVPVRLVQKTSRPRRPAIKVTNEERIAYNQLMLALSITSSKLKLVKDKVEGIEERKSVGRSER